MNAPLYNQEGKTVGEVALPASIFEKKWNPDLVYRVAHAMRENARLPVAHTKDRGEVRGGGRKPWQQKGTGRARHGSSRSPIWIGGGVTHGPRNERKYGEKINKKERRAALFSLLAQKAREGELLFLENLAFSGGKTREAREMLVKIAAASGHVGLTYKRGSRGLVALPSANESASRALRNISVVSCKRMKDISVADLLTYKYLIVVAPEIAFKSL